MVTASASIGIVGAGLVGKSWALVFAKAGHSVSVYDAREGIRTDLMIELRRAIEDQKAYGLVDDVEAVAARIGIAESLEEAVAEADYIQESVFETVEIKRAVAMTIGAAMRDDAVVGSSSSGIPASVFTAEAPLRNRFLVAHPVNPPHLIPLVELVPSPWTDGTITPWLRDLMEKAGQKPVTINREIEGFVLNRLQGALLNEAWALFDAGVATAADIDRCVSEGLGPRWSFMGPFETIDLNAPGGIEDYARRLGPLYHKVALDRRDPSLWSPALVARIALERRDLLPADQLAARSAWRDRRLLALTAHRNGEPDA